MTASFLILSSLTLGTLIAGFVALATLELADRRRVRRSHLGPRGSLTFLFRDEVLVDATPSARRLLAQSDRLASDWHRFVSLFEADFVGLQETMATLVDTGQVALSGRQGQVLTASWIDGLARIAIASAVTPVALNTGLLRAAQGESDHLHRVISAMPWLVWEQDDQGVITWASESYLALANQGERAGDQAPWPPAALFRVGPTTAEQSQRLALAIETDGAKSWFEVTGRSIGTRMVFCAVPADDLVDAEKSLRNFVQTLTKTFAHLRVGLAIFDRRRNLVLFNPALTDLTRLPPDFLARRPSMTDVFDRLRENRMIPEPRDYIAWRQQIEEIDRSSKDGLYEANWTLPSGQTWRVTGRPHPDGAIALVFEDISREVSLTRRHRAEIELSQSMLDQLDEALGVFTETGALGVTNAAFDRMWSIDQTRVLGQMTIIDLMRLWQERCLPTPAWGDLRDDILGREPRAEWSADIQALSGTRLTLRVVPVAHGATMVSFLENVPEPLAFASRRRNDVASTLN